MNNSLNSVSLNKRLINNIEYIASVDKKLAITLDKERKNIDFSSMSSEDYLSYSYNSKVVFDSIDALVEDINLNSSIGRKIASVRLKSNAKHTFDIESLDQLIIDKHDSEILDYLPCFSDENFLASSKVRDLLYLGSLQALTFCESLISNPDNLETSLPADDIGKLFSVTILSLIHI